MAFKISAEELHQLERDLATNHETLGPQVRQVIERGALGVRRDARRMVRQQVRGVYLPHYPKSITFDIEEQPGQYAEAEIGPDTSMRQGGMGPGVELGSVHTAPTPHLFPAFDENLPRVWKHMRQVVNDHMTALGRR